MKKLLLPTLLLSSTLFALPVGNPGEASLFCQGLLPCYLLEGIGCKYFNFRTGFAGNYVFEHFLRNKRDSSQLENSALYSNSAYFALNACNRLDLFGTIGISNLRFSGNISSFAFFSSMLPLDTVGPRLEIETRPEFSWSAGGRITLWRCRGFLFGFEGEYFRAEPRVSKITHAKLLSNYPTSTLPHLKALYSEWQLGLGLAHQCDFFVPYAAIKWSSVRIHWHNALPRNLFTVGMIDIDGLTFPGTLITLNDLKNKKFLGYAIGCSFLCCNSSLLTIEGRFADEIALYVNGQIRF